MGFGFALLLFDEEGDDDIAEFFVGGLGLAHGASGGLGDVDLGLPGVDEGDHVHGRDVHTLGQASGIGDEASGRCFEVLQKGFAVSGVLAAVDMEDVEAFDVLLEAPGALSSELLG